MTQAETMPELGPVTPVLRIFDADKAREFYSGFLGFQIVFEHRFGPNFPLYMGLMLSNCAIHLSEHHGDATPGSHVRIKCGDIQSYARHLAGKEYRYAKPSTDIARTDHDTMEMTLTDPFGNRLTFVEIC